MKKADLREVRQAGRETFVKNTGTLRRRILLGIPTLGVIRYEFLTHRQHAAIPINWAAGEVVASHLPESIVSMNYTTPDAQNVIVERLILDKFDWLLFIEDDTLIPPQAFLTIATHMDRGDIPIISGLYYSKGEPSWPLVFRGRGNGCFRNFKQGDWVWADGVPMGFCLIHSSILEWFWKNSPEYTLPDGHKLRRVFEFPRKSWYDPEQDRYFSLMGTSDLALCDRIIKENVLAKTGWAAVAKRRYPFLVDTSIFCGHITLQGEIYPQHAREILMPLKNNVESLTRISKT